MIIDRVEKMLKQAIEIEPDDADAYVLLGHHYRGRSTPQKWV